MIKKFILLSSSLVLALSLLLSGPISQAFAQQNPQDNLTPQTFNDVNPLMSSTADKSLATQFSTPGGVLSRVLLFAFPIAGLILFVMIVMGGFEILSGATDKKSMDTGKNRITSALVGFLLLFASYWIVQVVQVIFGVKILF